MSRPVVGLAAWRRNLPTLIGSPETLHAVAHLYVESLAEVAAVPLILPGARPVSEAAEFLDLLDGLVLTGGGDVDPAAYRAERTAAYDDDFDADAWEIALIGEARRRRLPLLAICRGMQVLNVAQGGTLIQEVTAPGTVHEPLAGDADELLGRRHRVDLAPGGVLADWYGTTRLDVNTLHHQGVDRLGDGLVTEAVAEDGLVEALRVDDGWFALGVQWHPERLPGARRPLFAGFVSALADRGSGYRSPSWEMTSRPNNSIPEVP
ncbi:gamma-glutamyl-gamma-aminobutyrate hydrolase family protein [soil metagenome]